MEKINKIVKQILIIFTLLFLANCAGFDRGCSSCMASSFATDWVVVQYKIDGTPINCWKLTNVSIANEQSSDGIYWKSPQGHLVHISGWYNRVQVSGSNFESAAKDIGVDLARCENGKYKEETVKVPTTIVQE
jgi:hypothetical protein